MKVWMLLCLLMQDTSHAQTPTATSKSDIRIIRTHLVAGRVEVYVEGEWKAVCRTRWGERDARVVCRQLGFSDEGARACRRSCFGESTLSAGLVNFTCTGNETRLTDCQHKINNGCGEDAGVICRDVIKTTSSPVVTLSLLTTPVVTTITQQVTSTVTQQVTSTVAQQVTSTITQQVTSTVTQPVTSTVTQPVTSTVAQQFINTITHEVKESYKEEATNCTALAGGLGGLTALLALLLVLVVLGWVCMCYRRKERSAIIKERNNNGTDDERFFNNPNYDTVILSEPHQYSLDGPQDTPFSSGTQPPDATYDATSDEKDHVQEVRGVGLYSTYDVITIENIDHRDEDNTEEAAVVAKFQKEGVHKEEEEAALYSVVTKPQDILTVPEEY